MRTSFANLTVVGALLLSIGSTRADGPLHERVDALIAAGHPDYDKHAAPVASDAEFLRRVSLDLTGTIPTVKRGPRLPRRPLGGQPRATDRPSADAPRIRPPAGAALRRCLMERRRTRRCRATLAGVPAHVVRGRTSRRTSWSARSCPPTASDPKNRGPAKFYLDREAEPNAGDPRRRPAVPRHEPPVRPVPRPPARRRLQAGALLRPVRLPQPHVPVPERDGRRRPCSPRRPTAR